MEHKHIPTKDFRWSHTKHTCVCGFKTTSIAAFQEHLSSSYSKNKDVICGHCVKSCKLTETTDRDYTCFIGHELC